jgi:uncharacterized LabA/DUF88 family protein
MQERMTRTVVFVDYQNMYRSAREAFSWEDDAGHFGNFRPYGMGRRMVREGNRRLEQVRVYTGIHTPLRNPVQHGHMQRRMSAWIAESPEKVEVFPRPLRYLKSRPGGEEKGVDVELAIDLVTLALDNAFDAVVLASADSDLVPAIQFVADRFPGKAIETIAWAPLPGCEPPAALDLPRGDVTRTRISKSDFERIAHKTNFYLPTSDASDRIDSDRWRRIRGRYGTRPSNE